MIILGISLYFICFCSVWAAFLFSSSDNNYKFNQKVNKWEWLGVTGASLIAPVTWIITGIVLTVLLFYYLYKNIVRIIGKIREEIRQEEAAEKRRKEHRKFLEEQKKLAMEIEERRYVESAKPNEQLVLPWERKSPWEKEYERY